MNQKISPRIGILLNWRPEEFDLTIAYEIIKTKRKYAWGTGGVIKKPGEKELPNGKILGLLKTSGQNNILYGVIIDLSHEFHEYLNSPQTKSILLKDEHKKYRPDNLKGLKSKAILFISDVFILKDQIQADTIRVWNGEIFSSGHRSAVFIDLKNSGLDSNKIISKRRKFDSFSDNPLVQILDYKEDDLTSTFCFLLKNHEDIAKEFFNLCNINKKPINFEIYLRKKIEKTNRRNIPDMTFEWENDSSNIFVEAKLDSPINKNQLKRYSSKGKVICITRYGEEKEVKKEFRGISFISWEDIYRIIEKISNNNRSQKMYMVKYFLGYLTYLGCSNSNSI